MEREWKFQDFVCKRKWFILNRQSLDMCILGSIDLSYDRDSYINIFGWGWIVSKTLVPKLKGSHLEPHCWKSEVTIVNGMRVCH